MVFGEGDYRYELVENWGNFPNTWKIAVVPGICIDNKDRLYVLSRGVPPIAVLDTEGKCLEHWGDGVFVRAHGVYLTEDDQVYCADDGAHAVYKFDQNRELIFTLGNKGVPSDTGCVDKKLETIVRSAGPFNFPTNVALAKNGDIYVSDGYGNARVHVFDPEGHLKFSWGEPGTKPGQFRLPHSLRFDKNETLYVCDRANNRIQLFDLEGNYKDEWGGFERPADMFIDNEQGIMYVAECKRCSVFDGTPSRVTIVDMKGEILARIGGDKPYDPAIGHHTAHGIAVDSEGNLYVAEVGQKAPEGYVGLKKYRRIK